MKTAKRQVIIGEKEVQVITLKNNQGMEVEFLSLGGIITKIMTPDKVGNIENVVLAFKDLETYKDNSPFFGTIVGRTSGRIHKGQCTINDKKYEFPLNNNQNSLHGGNEGFNSKIWEVHVVEGEQEVAAELSYTSPDGEEGYPGNLQTKVTYALNNQNELIISYDAVSDQDTLVNLTNHSYFNLSGEAKHQIIGHKMCIHSDKVCRLDGESIPTGEWLDVKVDTAFDFNKPKVIGKDIDATETSLQSGYDHPWLLNKKAEIDVYYYDPISGRKMEVKTDEKAVVVYAMNFADPLMLMNGKMAEPRYGICFETQGLPIGYNECHKEGSILKAGEKYHKVTCFKFSVEA